MIATKAWYKHKTKQAKHKEKSYAKLRKKKEFAQKNYAKLRKINPARLSKE